MSASRSSPGTAAGALAILLALSALATRASDAGEAKDQDPRAAPAHGAKPSPPAEAQASPAARALRRGEPMDLNAATAADLMLLPRIGPRLAERILSDRQANGPYATLEDLARVRGIGPKTVARLRPLLRTAPTGGAGEGAPAPSHDKDASLAPPKGVH